MKIAINAFFTLSEAASAHSAQVAVPQTRARIIVKNAQIISRFSAANPSTPNPTARTTAITIIGRIEIHIEGTFFLASVIFYHSYFCQIRNAFRAGHLPRNPPAPICNMSYVALIIIFSRQSSMDTPRDSVSFLYSSANCSVTGPGTCFPIFFPSIILTGTTSPTVPQINTSSAL